MEPGELPDTTVTVSTNHLRQMGQQLSHLHRWVRHLVGKVKMLESESSSLRELTHWQAKRIERLEEGLPVRSPSTQPLTAGH